MILGHRIQLDPTQEQITQFKKAVGVSRFVFNWALDRWNKQYLAHKGNNTLPKPTVNLLKTEFNSIKLDLFPWVYESPKDANQQPFADLAVAWTNFFKHKKQRPKFKSKHKDKDKFYVSNDQFWVDEYVVKLPVIGKVRMTEKLRFPDGRIMSGSVSRIADKWFISINVDVEDAYKKENLNNKNGIIAIDLGLNSFTTDSNGNKIVAPKPLKKHTKKLKRLQRQHARKQKGSKNKEKSRLKLARKHKQIADIRRDFIHKTTTQLCNENQVIVMESLKVQNMMKNHKLAKAISDVGWGEFRRQVEYKSLIYDNLVIKADTFFPSSKTCSNCGSINHDLTLSDRIFSCPDCGFSIDRDIGATYNLHTLGLREIHACGHENHCNESNLVVSSVDETRNNECKNE
jgi:putative transposase